MKLRYSWRLKWPMIITIFTSLIEGNDNQNAHAKFRVERSKTYWDIDKQIFVSMAYLAGKIRHHALCKTVSCFSETPQWGWSCWKLIAIKPCHSMQMTLVDHGFRACNPRVGCCIQREEVNKFVWYCRAGFLWFPFNGSQFCQHLHGKCRITNFKSKCSKTTRLFSICNIKKDKITQFIEQANSRLKFPTWKPCSWHKSLQRRKICTTV